MSVVEKIKSVSEVAEEFSKEKPRITFTSDCLVTAENYVSVKHFDGMEILLEFSNYDIRLSGCELVIESFTPNRITICGKIKDMTFVSFSVEDGA